jgi:hypothetical protein
VPSLPLYSSPSARALLAGAGRRYPLRLLSGQQNLLASQKIDVRYRLEMLREEME